MFNSATGSRITAGKFQFLLLILLISLISLSFIFDPPSQTTSGANELG